jgi:hypothetical protein
MRVIVTTSVAPSEVLQFDVPLPPHAQGLLHGDFLRDVFVVHPETYSRLIDRLGPLEQAGIAVDDLVPEEEAEARLAFHSLQTRILRGELVPGRD